MDTFEAIFKVLVIGLVLGAGLPAVFAIGLRLYAAGSGDANADGTTTAPNPALKAAGGFLFLLIAAVIVIGILWITRTTINYHFGVNLFPFAPVK